MVSVSLEDRFQTLFESLESDEIRNYSFRKQWQETRVIEVPFKRWREELVFRGGDNDFSLGSLALVTNVTPPTARGYEVLSHRVVQGQLHSTLGQAEIDARMALSVSGTEDVVRYVRDWDEKYTELESQNVIGRRVAGKIITLANEALSKKYYKPLEAHQI